MLCDAPANFHNGRFLKCIRADDFRRHLAGDRQQRNTIEFGIRDTGDQIRRTWTARGHYNPDFARGSSVPLRGKGSTLFVTRKNGSKPIFVTRQSLVHRHAASARVGENDLNAVIHKGFHHNFCTGHDCGFLAVGYRSHSLSLLKLSFNSVKMWLLKKGICSSMPQMASFERILSRTNAKSV